MTPRILTLTGPSCAGKSTLEKMLKEHGFANVISTTTRPMREGEVDGQSYYFVSREVFADIDGRGQFVESVEFNGNRYGISVQEIERVAAMGKPIVVVVEPNGLEQLHHYAADEGWTVVSVFVSNPLGVIGERFLQRYTEDLLKAVSTGTTDKVLDTYQKRIASLLDDELYWEGEIPVHYIDMWVQRFDAFNDQQVIREIIQTLEDKSAIEDAGSAP